MLLENARMFRDIYHVLTVVRLSDISTMLQAEIHDHGGLKILLDSFYE